MKLMSKLLEISNEVFSNLGGGNFTEDDFQWAFGYECDHQKIEYLREMRLEIFYKNIPIKLGAPDFVLTKTRPKSIIEIKLGQEIKNDHRQQLSQYLKSINKRPIKTLGKINDGFLINFYKNEPLYHFENKKGKTYHKIIIENFKFMKENHMKHIATEKLGQTNL